ncbi:hypothetical protein FSHL1_006284 [Fusarium sambucinum]
MSGLEGLGIVANVIAVAELSLKVIAWCSKYAQDVKNSHDGRARLLQATITLHYESDKVRDLLSRKGSKLQASQRLYSAIGSSEIQLRELESQLSQKGNRSSLKWPLQKEKVENAIRHIEKSIKTMQGMLQIDIADLLVGIDDRAEAEEQRAAIDQLPYVGDAVWDSHAEERNGTCLPNTRENLLAELKDWIQDTTGKSKAVFWLNGMAGTGKSTISRTISQYLSQNGRLGATFFFKRGEADRGGISKLVPTIARQLAMNQPSLRPHIHAAIRNNSTITNNTVKMQFDTLIFDPLMKSPSEFSSESSITIVIDALDECDSETDIRLILNLFAATKKIQCPRPRVFVTSRPDLPVRLGFRDVEDSYQDLILHEISAPVIKQDISTFFYHKMKVIREDWNASVGEKRNLPQDWPGSECVQLLTNKAVPLFIFAATACRFISERQLGSPEKQLHRFLEYQTEGTAAQLDFTYRPVLAQFFRSNYSKTIDRQVIHEFQHVVGTIVNLLNPLSASALSSLLGIDQDIIDSKLDLLHSVLDVPSSPDLPVRMLHASFRDYLISPKTREHQFWIDEKKSAEDLAKDCLRVMETLQPDICHLKMPGTHRSILKPEFINACIPPEVQYACLYWINHRVVAGLGPGDATRILKFLKQHLLHWIEAMSLLGRAFQITKLMRELQSSIPIESTGDEPELINFLNDAIRFVDTDIQTIDLAPLQIHYSLLVMAPSNSLVRQIFAVKAPACVTLLSGQEVNWDSRLCLLGNSDDLPLNLMEFSSDSKFLCFISENGHLNVWDCDTGECIHDIEPDPRHFLITAQDSVEDSRVSFEFSTPTVSPDSKSVAVILMQHNHPYSPKILMFDLQTGQILCNISHHGSLSAFAFSRDSKSIWSCARDGQTCVWELCTGTCTKRLDFPVKWSDQTRIELSLGGPKVLIVWDPGKADVWYLETSKVDKSFPIQWYEAYFFDGSVSPDGRLLVTPSSDGLSLVVWDISKHKLLWKLSEDMMKNYRGVLTKFLPESTFLATSDFKSVRIWDMRDGKCFKTLTLDDDDDVILQSMTFSPDTRYLISTQFSYYSLVQETRLWDISTGTNVVLNIKHSYKYGLLLFSPDCKKIVSRTHNDLVQQWDWQRLLEVPPKAASELQSLVFSPDLSMTAALFQNNHISIWDSETGALLRGISCPGAEYMGFSPDSSLVATTMSRDSVQVWSLHEPDVEWQFIHTSHRVGLTFSPDSKAIATLGTEIKIWVRENDTFRFKTLLSSQGEGSSLCFSRDAKLISASRRDRVDIWNCDTGQLVQSLPSMSLRRVLSIDLQPSTVSSYAIVVAVEAHVEVWDVEACSFILQDDLISYNHTVSSTGTFIVASANRGVRIWNWSTGDTLVALPLPFRISTLEDFIPESLTVRTNGGNWVLSCQPQQLTQMFGVGPKNEWIQWKDHNLFKLPFDLQSGSIKVAVIPGEPGESLGFTVAIWPRSGRDVIILRFSNEGGMLDDLISR